MDFFDSIVYDDIESIGYVIEAGDSGECDYCEEESKRLINGLCAKCRDFFLKKKLSTFMRGHSDAIFRR